MLAATFALLAVTPLCLAFAETRWMGVTGLIVLAYLHPLLLCVVMLLIAATSVLFIYWKRRSSNAFE
jgi:hypothetical protein